MIDKKINKKTIQEICRKGGDPVYFLTHRVKEKVC